MADPNQISSGDNWGGGGGLGKVGSELVSMATDSSHRVIMGKIL